MSLHKYLSKDDKKKHFSFELYGSKGSWQRRPQKPDCIMSLRKDLAFGSDEEKLIAANKLHEIGDLNDNQYNYVLSKISPSE